MNHLIKLNKSLFIQNRSLLIFSQFDNQKRWSSNDITTKYTTEATSPIVGFIENSITNFHDLSGLEWASTISLAALSLRILVLFPIRIYTEHKTAQMANCQAEIIERLQLKMRRFASINLSEIQRHKQTQFKLIKNEVFKREKCKPSQLFAATILEFTAWLSVSMAIRNLTLQNSLAQISMTTEGALWFKNLTIIDEYYLLPLIYASVSLMNILYSSLGQQEQQQRQDRIIMNLLVNSNKYVSVVTILSFAAICAKLPAAVSLFWACTQTINLMERLVIDTPRLRRFFNIPLAPNELKRPFSFKYDQLRKMFKVSK